MARFFSDENVPLEVVRVLRSLGHDVLTAFEAGQATRNTQVEVCSSYFPYKICKFEYYHETV